MLALVAGLAACSSGPPASRPAERVVVVSYDGLGADLAWGWIEGGLARDPDGLSAVAGSGLAVRRLRMVTPTLTAVNHATLATGRWPARHGIVSNLFRPAGAPVTERASGFDHPLEAETLWQAARRQEVATAVILWPGVDGSTPERSGDVGLAWPTRPLAAGEVVPLQPAAGAPRPGLPSRDGLPAVAWSVPVPLVGGGGELSLEVVAVDGEEDGIARYDAVLLREPGQEGFRAVAELGWIELDVAVRGVGDESPRHYRSFTKVLRLDRRTGAVRLYRGAFWATSGYPEGFVDRVEAELGPWPGIPDDRELARWWLDIAEGIDLDTFLEQAERLDRWLDAATEIALRTEPARLVLSYRPTPDEYQHASLIVDRRQWAWSPGKALAAGEGLKRIGRSVDRSVGDLARALDLGRDALVVVSDHGLAPLHDVVHLNTVLAAAGLVSTVEGAGGRRVAPDTPMIAVSSGGAAHLYLNLEGREPGGVVSAAEAPALLERAARALADLEVDGVPVVERVLDRVRAAREGLDHANGGDLVVLLAPGFAASSALAAEPVAPSRYYAQHGYHAGLDAMCGLLLARGAGVAPGARAEMPATTVAPLVAGLLGIEPPR